MFSAGNGRANLARNRYRLRGFKQNAALLVSIIIPVLWQNRLILGLRVPVNTRKHPLETNPDEITCNVWLVQCTGLLQSGLPGRVSSVNSYPEPRFVLPAKSTGAAIPEYRFASRPKTAVPRDPFHKAPAQPVYNR